MAIKTKTDLVINMLKEQNISKNELAKRTGISRAYVYFALNNNIPVGNKFISAMIDYFGMSFEELFFYDHNYTKCKNKNNNKYKESNLTSNPSDLPQDKRTTSNQSICTSKQPDDI